jgi:hypothetical protein
MIEYLRELWLPDPTTAEPKQTRAGEQHGEFFSVKSLQNFTMQEHPQNVDLNKCRAT